MTKLTYDPMVYQLAAEVVASCGSSKGVCWFDKFTCTAVARVSPEGNKSYVYAYQDVFRPDWPCNDWWNGKLSYENQLARAIALDLTALMAEDGTL